MSKEPISTDFPAGDFIFENASRAVFGRRRPTSPTIPGHAVNGVPAHSSVTDEGTSASASGGRRLRRWSVAELIARAVAAPPPSTT
jgi:hypothetical protein